MAQAYGESTANKKSNARYTYCLGTKTKTSFFFRWSSSCGWYYDFGEILFGEMVQTTYFGTGPGGKRCFFFAVILQLWLVLWLWWDFFWRDGAENVFLEDEGPTPWRNTVQRDASFRSSFRTMKLKTPTGPGTVRCWTLQKTVGQFSWRDVGKFKRLLFWCFQFDDQQGSWISQSSADGNVSGISPMDKWISAVWRKIWIQKGPGAGGDRVKTKAFLEFFSSLRIQICPDRIRDFPYNPMTWGWDFSTINPTRNREGFGFLGGCNERRLKLLWFQRILQIFSFDIHCGSRHATINKMLGFLLDDDKPILSTWSLTARPWKVESYRNPNGKDRFPSTNFQG